MGFIKTLLGLNDRINSLEKMVDVLFKYVINLTPVKCVEGETVDFFKVTEYGIWGEPIGGEKVSGGIVLDVDKTHIQYGDSVVVTYTILHDGEKHIVNEEHVSPLK